MTNDQTPMTNDQTPMTKGQEEAVGHWSLVIGRSQMRRRALTLEEYESGVRAGDVSVLARALTLIESSSPRHKPLAETLLTRLLPHTGRSIRVGITGVPGVGKSTFIDTLGVYLVRRGLRVAVLAVDPSSGVSGGSILGD